MANAHDGRTKTLLNTCMICGLSTFDIHEPGEGATWLANVTLLCDPDDEIGSIIPTLRYDNFRKSAISSECEARSEGFRPRSEASPIEARPGAAHRPGTYYHLLAEEDDELPISVHVFQKRPIFRPPQTGQTKHYLPVHDACLKVAERLWETSPTTAYIKDLRGLFLALAWRYTIGVRCYVETEPMFEFPPNYHMGYDWRMRWAPWWQRWHNDEVFNPADGLPGNDESPKDRILKLWATDPYKTQLATSDLLRNLEQTPRREPRKFDQLFFRLPPEVRAMIFDAIAFRDLPRVTTSVLPQSVWLRQLKSGIALPWLWELKAEKDLLDAKNAESCPGGDDFEWNWELLVRQMSRGLDFGVKADVPDGTNPDVPIKDGENVVRSDDTFWETRNYYNDLQYVPPGLLNRRRIWQLLEEAFVGDYLPQTTTTYPISHFSGPRWVMEQYLQLPWNKSGQLLKTPKWIPSFDLQPYVRRVGGQVYIKNDIIRPMQYWQDPGGYWKRLIYKLSREREVAGPKAAPPEHVWEVLRRLGYPI